MNPLKGKRWICVHFNFVCVLCEACFMPQELIWVAQVQLKKKIKNRIGHTLFL